jgi:microcystin-dependent protein
MFAGNFAPVGWAFCNGAIIPIDQNDALFNLIGTTYGGDGQTTFALPNLQSRVPVHVGPSFALAQTGGAESVTLTTSQIPLHSHPIIADSASGTTGNPSNAFYANAAPANLYTVPNDPANPDAPIYRNFNAAVLPSQGGSQPHDNMIPFVCVNYILSLFGIFPSQT